MLVYNTATAGSGGTAVTPGYYYWSGTWVRLFTSAANIVLPDSDGDGIIDQLDIEPNSTAGCPVDSRGIILDTDGDGVPDCMDYEKLTLQKCFPVTGNGVGTCPLDNSWQVTGNNGTTDGSNFIGTTDNVPLNLRVNNQRTGRIELNDATANTFLGYLAGKVNTGSRNTANGYQVLFSNTSGNRNTAKGSYALFSNTTGSHNTADGGAVLYSNTTGSYNTANGYSTLTFNTTGNDNTASGDEALYYNLTGNNNTASGYEALSSNLAGEANTATGYHALLHNTTGGSNTGHGLGALRENVAGSYNTAMGHDALVLTTGSSNTAVGFHALQTNTTGNFNTAIGDSADVVSGALTNATAIGKGAEVNASNKIRLGNAAVSVIEGQVPFSSPSDKRFKYNIKADVPGLDFIQKLTPVTYYFDEEKLARFTKTGELSSNDLYPVAYRTNRQLHTGFLAQDVEKAATELGYHFDGVHAPTNDKDHYSLANSQFIMPLVKAVQEQQQQIAEQQQQNNKQKEQIEKLTNENEKIKILEVQLTELIKEVKALKAQ